MQKHLKVLSALVLASIAASHAPEAQAKFVFMHNHPDLRWYSIESEHFVVHYPRSRKEEGNEHYLDTSTSAALVSRSAEEMWPKQCANYNYYLKEKIHIVLLNQSDDLEGFTVPAWDWIEISTNPGSYFYRTRGRQEWFSDVLVHEFGHIISLKPNTFLAEGSMGVLLGGLYQDGITNVAGGGEYFLMEDSPFVFVEGSSEGSSDISGYNWWTAARDQTIRTSILQGRFLKYDRAPGLLPPYGWQDWERAYQEGYSFNLYLRSRFGEDVYQKFAIEAGKHWRLNWWSVVEEVVGVDAKTLFEDFERYLTETYEAQYEAIKAEGEAVGRELLPAKPEWEFASPSEREAWESKAYYNQWKEREKTGTWVMEPRYDAKSGIFGIHNRGVVTLVRTDIDNEVAFTGQYPANPQNALQQMKESTAFPADFMAAWDFVPGKEQVVVAGSEHMIPSRFSEFTGMQWNADGYEWKQLWVLDIREREEKRQGVKFKTWAPKTVGKHTLLEKDAARPIPNTLRAFDPSVSPDGTRVAFLQYNDGTANVAVINIDGTGKKLLTNYDDGTWMQKPSWSPDGQKVLFAAFRNYQQNLYTVNADGTDLQAITWDAWEEEDAVWTADNKIWFAAEPTGVYNIFCLDLNTRRVKQVTNVIGGAMSPMVTPDGNLVYSYFEAYGWKPYGLAKADFLNKDVTHLFNVSPDPSVVKASVEYQEDFSAVKATAKPYRMMRSLMPPSGYPMFRLENPSTTEVSVSGGFGFIVQDYVEKNGAWVQAELGGDLYGLVQYFNQTWYPTLIVTGLVYQGKYEYGIDYDLDDRKETEYDAYTLESKQNSIQHMVAVGLSLPWSDRWSTFLFANPWDYGFRELDGQGFEPYMREIEVGAVVEFATLGGYDEGLPNPRAGRLVELDFSHGYTDIVFADYGGVGIDDGMELDAYHYNKGELRWTEQLNIPTFGGLGFLQAAREHDHRIQVDFRAGYVDRNVDLNDEYHAGGQHPYDWGHGTLRPNTLFAGYPPWSITGETMGILNLTYRFPIVRSLQKRIGPLYFGSVYAQLGGTAGNLWSFRPPEDPSLYHMNLYDERVANNPEDVKREIPFVDEAYKNGNYLLYDLQHEIRVKMNVFNGMSWDSFFRVAYGFNEIRGYGDVNGDDVYDTSDNARGDELSNETEPAGFRFYLGLGTGW